jgi:uncharacterized protein (DUF302 family)
VQRRLGSRKSPPVRLFGYRSPGNRQLLSSQRSPPVQAQGGLNISTARVRPKAGAKAGASAPAPRASAHFLGEIDQSKLAAEAGIALRPSTLLIFGNPPLGTLFITAKPEAGLDWPVRLLVSQDDSGQVWAIYTDFAWIAQRHEIANRQAEFAKAAEVIASITGSVAQ